MATLGIEGIEARGFPHGLSTTILLIIKNQHTMSSKRLGYMMFYPSDWKNDQRIKCLSMHDRAVWFEILLVMFLSEERGKLVVNGKPMTGALLAKNMGCEARVLKKSLQKILECGVAYVDENNTICNRRMLEDERKSKIKADNGAKGGNPVLVNQKAKAALTVSQPYSDSDTNSDTNTNSFSNTESEAALRKRCTDNETWLQQTAQITGIEKEKIKTFCNHWITKAKIRYHLKNYPVSVLTGYMLDALEKEKSNLIPQQKKEESIMDRWN